MSWLASDVKIKIKGELAMSGTIIIECYEDHSKNRTFTTIHEGYLDAADYINYLRSAGYTPDGDISQVRNYLEMSGLGHLLD